MRIKTNFELLIFEVLIDMFLLKEFSEKLTISEMVTHRHYKKHENISKTEQFIKSKNNFRMQIRVKFQTR